MREPRAKQRFPLGGKRLYEQLRSDYEPVFVEVFPESECARARADLEATLLYTESCDPMLYFWPVERQHVVAHFNMRPAELERLVKALQRDGAVWITAIYRSPGNPTGQQSRRWEDLLKVEKFVYEHWGDAEKFMSHRYGRETLDPLAVPGARSGGDRAGAGAAAPDPGRLTDGQRQDHDGDGVAVASA